MAIRRQGLAAALLLFGLVVEGSTAVIAYLARSILDEQVFSTRLVASLDEPGVSTYVARGIADAVVAADRDLTGIKPVITIFARSVVRSEPFKALVRRAARDAHRVVFSEGAENVLLSIPDVGVLLRNALRTVSPEIAQRIPPDVRAVLETEVGALSSSVLFALRAVNRVRLAARVGLVIGLLLLIASVIVATNRRQALLNAGLGLLAVAAVLALVVPLGGAALSGAVGDPLLRDAVRDVWTVFAGGLWNWAIGLAAVALMMVSAAGAFLERVALLDVVRRGLAEIATRQVSRRWESARVIALIVVGIFAMAAPLATLTTAVVVAGAITLVLAVHSLAALVAPPSLVATSSTDQLRLNPALAVALSCVTVTAAAMGLGAATLRFRTPLSVPAVASATFECNGAVALCDRRLDEITFPGAHNAMSSPDDPNWMFPNQDKALPELLRLGLRAFMLDIVHGRPAGKWVLTDFKSETRRAKFEAAIGPEAFAAVMRVRDQFAGGDGPLHLYLCHGFCELGAVPLDSTLFELRRFMVTHPREVVLLILEDHAPASDIAAAFEAYELTRYAYRGPPRGPFPTLREMILSGQRLFVMGENDTGDVPWYHQAFEVMQETPYTFHAPEEFSCDHNRGDQASPLFLINHWVETTPSPRPSNAELVNTETALVDRARECSRVRGMTPNVVAVDFAGIGDIVRAAAVLNGLAEPHR